MEDQALIVEFYDYARLHASDLTPLHSLEDAIEARLAETGAGTLDGNEIAMDGSDGRIYCYGPDANTMLNVLVELLKRSPITKDGKVLLQFGPPGKTTAREEWSINDLPSGVI